MHRSLYNLAFYALSPAVISRLAYRSWQSPMYRKRWLERFGFFGELQLDQSLWVHAVSVGEVMAARPLIDALLERYPDTPLLVTTMTPTGSERVQSLWADRVVHVYLPYDWPDAVSRLIERVNPRLLMIMETELWPNVVHQCADRDIPVVLVNARLSERSARGYQRIKAITVPMLQRLSLIMAQGEADAQRFHALGVPTSKLQRCGNIKFDIRFDDAFFEGVHELKNQLVNRPVWIAASTHEGEEAQVIRAFDLIRDQAPNALLILVPRHPERFESVATLLSDGGYAFQRRTQCIEHQGAIDEKTQVLLGDTMGELPLLIAASDIAFIGGSLIVHGGHNMIEAIALGVPALSGPSFYNFQAIAEELVDSGVLSIVDNAEQLAAQVLEHLSHIFPNLKNQHLSSSGTDVEYLDEVKKRCDRVMQKHRGVLQGIMLQVEHLLVKTLDNKADDNPKRPQ